MLGRMASRMLTSLAVLCASLSWAGWVYLRTIGDPARSEEMATAIIDDDAARQQVASSFALQLVRASGIDRSNIDLVEAAVETALADPRVSADVISAFGAAHANALGVEDERDTTIDTNAMLAAVRDQVAVLNPELAVALPDGVLPEITLPKFHPPGVAPLRTAAESATTLLAIAAAVLAAIAFAFGDRRGVLRRVGLWAVCSGVGWALLPVLIVAGARAWASDVDKIVEAAVRSSVDGVMPVAIALVVGGVAAIVVSFVPSLWPERDDVYRRGTVVQSPPRARPASGPTTAGHPAAHQPAHQAVPPPTYAPQPPRTDTWTPSGQGPVTPAYTPQTPAAAAPRPSAPPPPAPVPDDVDPWATYFGPTGDR